MRRNRFFASLVTVALAAFSIGTATAWFSDSATIRFEISAADDFGGNHGAKVWVCKLIGPPDNPSVKRGKNPIHVSANSVDASEGFSDAHPSYVVEHGDVICTVPDGDQSPESDTKVAPEPGVIETPSIEEPTPPDSTTTTSTVAESTTTSSTTTSTTTTTTVPVSSTTALPEEPQTTTSTVAQIDD